MIRRRPTLIIIIVVALAAMITLDMSSMQSLLTPEVQAAMAHGVLPLWCQYTLMFGGLAVEIVATLGIFQGQNWARWLYTVSGGLITGIRIVTSTQWTVLIPGLVTFLVISFFLFSPEATLFFKPRRRGKQEPLT